MDVRTDDIVKDLQIKVDADHDTVSGRFEWKATLCQDKAPDQVQREVQQMGQAVKRQVYGEVLQAVDRQIVAQWQLANAALQKRGTRAFTFVTPFGVVPIQRTRLYNRQDACWHVPSAVVWHTPQQRCIVEGLREAVCEEMSSLSVRKSARHLAEQAGEAQLLGNSTIVKIVHDEGGQLLETQRQRAVSVLRRHPEAIETGLATLPQEEPNESSPAASVLEKAADQPPADEERLDELSLAEEQAALQIAVGFLDEKTSTEQIPGTEATDQAASSPGTKHAPRQLEPGWVHCQVDEVKTKAQASSGCKENWTYTATVQLGGRCHYFAEASAEQLWRGVAALLCCLGVRRGGLQLLVLADGAAWIRKWFEGLKLPGATMILCWFHLAKRVYQDLSGAGFCKARREAIQREVLHHLWHGELAGAVWFLWGVREQARTPQWITELIRYLLRRRHYLPNYAARHEAGLWIASTRVEKWNDWSVADRCKRRGMSWTNHGVLSLASHQANRYNGEMDSWRAGRELPAWEPGEPPQEASRFALAS